MWSHRRAFLVVLALLLCLVNACQNPSGGQRKLAIFSLEEAAEFRQSEEEWQSPPRMRALAPGPRIVFHRPPVKDVADGPLIETVSPTDFVIFFEANRAPVDMDSLQIDAKKWLFTKSLTARLRPYIQGASIQAKGVSIPEGLFVIQIEIADVAGAKTVGTYRLMAKAQ